MSDAALPDYPPSDQPAWQIVGKEALAMAAAGALFPLGLLASKRRTPRAREQRTVVLVHGYMSNRSALLPLSLYLRWRGFSQILSFDYPSSLGVDRGAIALREYLRRHVRGGRIDLVCHSLGGLIARVYLQDLGGARRVDRCITLGTPHRGTYSAYWIPTRVATALRPDSRLLARVRSSRHCANGVRFVSIVAGSDNVVVPRVHAGCDEEIHIPHVGHVGMLFSPKVLRVVADRLS